MHEQSLWVIGGGNMGGALLARWAESETASAITLVDPGDVSSPAGVRHVSTLEAAGVDPDIVVAAVKPHLADTALTSLVSLMDERALFVSVMAGLKLDRLATIVPAGRHVRAMPNTATRLGKGVTGLCAPGLDPEGQERAETLFRAVGWVHWLSEEAQFDTLTAVSGSGPAYIFRIVEALAAAAADAGLDEALAQSLTRETLIGAAALLESAADSPAALRRAVTSPNGVTQAALEAMNEDPGVDGLMRATVEAAIARSRAMANE